MCWRRHSKNQRELLAQTRFVRWVWISTACSLTQTEWSAWTHCSHDRVLSERRAVLVPRCRTVISLLLSLSLSHTHTHTHTNTHTHSQQRSTAAQSQRTHTDDFFFLPPPLLPPPPLSHTRHMGLQSLYLCANLCACKPGCWHVGKSECSWLELCVCATS